MSAETAQPGPANPIGERTCRKCDQAKPVSPETWPYKKARTGLYGAHGQICLACEKQRKAEYEARRDKIAESVKSIATLDPTGKPDDKRKEITAANKLDVAHALKTGARVVNEYAPAVMARILEYLEDPESPHHIWALELLAQRILPRKLFEELGGQAAGVGSLNDKRPMFQINVLPATPGGPTEARVIEGQHEVIEEREVKLSE